jgi:hypothetical protein
MRACGASPFAEDARTLALSARAFWLAEVDPQVLTVEALTATACGDAIDFRRLATPLISVTATDGTEHLLLRDAFGHLRIDVTAGTALAGPIIPRVTLSGIETSAPKLLSLRRLHGLSRQGHLPRALFPAERRAPRWIAMLRTLDALDEGASQRDIAAALFGDERVADEWRGASDHLRSAVQRLTREARRLAEHGYRALLKPPNRL